MNLKTLHKTMLTALLLVTAVASGWGQNSYLTEDFSLCTGGTHATPSGTDISLTAAAMDSKMHTAGFTGSKVYEAGGEIKLSTSSIQGFITTPSLDLSANGGKATIKFDVAKYGTDAATVQVYLDGVAVGAVITPTSSTTYDNISIDITGGTATSVIKIAAVTKRCYIDNLVIQEPPIDATPPVATFAPTTGTTDIALNSPITITFDEAIRNIDDSPIADPTSLITLKETDAAGAAVTFTTTIDAAKKVITINPTNQKFNQAYYVAIAPVEDAAGNATTEKTSTYTTIAARTGKAITAFSFAEQTSAATIGDGTIAIEVASSATVTNLIATFTVSDGANVKVGAVDQVSATTPNDFTSPVTYTVTAEDGSTKDWVVTVTKAIVKSTETDITAFSFVEQTGPATIDAVNHTIAIEVGATTDITTLVPTITLSVGATVSPLSGVAQNFTSPVVYTVTAEDGTTTQNWTVTVTLASTIANTTTLAEKYYAGDNLTVTWTSANLTNVKVEWFDGTTWSDLATSVPATDGQYVIAIPAASKYGTAYKFRISDAAKATVKAESNAITIIAVVNNITEFKALTPNDIAKIKGEVFISFIRSANRNQKYIQDAEGGLLVDDPTPTGGQSGVITSAYAEKDGITGIEGKLVMYGTYTYEIVPTVDPGAKTSSNNTLTPKVITLAELKADHMKYQSMLVKVQGVTIKEANGTAKFVASSGASNYTMQLGAEEAVVRQAWKTGETDLIDATIPVGTLDIVGIVGQFTTGTPAVTTAQLQPRRVSDISVINGVETNNEVVTKAFPNPFSTDFKINAGKVVRNVVVSNMLGQKVMERTYNEIEIEVPASDLRTGVYFVTVKFEDGTTSTLRMVKK
jgi:hypothetical protein